MKQQTFIERLQNLHPSHKNKIFVTVAAVSIIGFGSLWINSVKQQMNGIDTGIASLTENSGTVLSASNHITIESTEIKNEKRYIYFKVENRTDDILNFSSTEQIKIILDDRPVSITDITDRQQSEFPAKILSNSTIYGSLILDDKASEKGTITFDNMYFETTPNNIFRENIEVDLSELKAIEELRS